MLQAYADHWALITGASSGIGAEFARQLAARGMHLVLSARREPLLTQLAAELHRVHGTKTEIIVADLSNPNEPVRLLDEIKKRGVTIELLVNNAGFGVISDAERTDVKRILEMVQVNVAALTELTLRALPEMLSRRHGGIINVASVAAFQPVGYMGAYSATKAYVLHFSEALWAEARQRGVTVMTLCPGTTRTEFFGVSGNPHWLEKHSAQEVKPVVRTALKALEKGRSYIVSGWKNYILSLLVRLATRATVVLKSMKYFRPKD
ncbi:MAG TPA: SDR family oxidoreductase [Planctomycetaceae bacterium]